MKRKIKIDGATVIISSDVIVIKTQFGRDKKPVFDEDADDFHPFDKGEFIAILARMGLASRPEYPVKKSRRAYGLPPAFWSVFDDLTGGDI